MGFGVCVYIVGDVHGNIHGLNRFINNQVRLHSQVKALAAEYEKSGEDFRVIILQCGDMGWYWPHVNHNGMLRNEIDFLPSGRVPIYWCGGNHEDWDRLDSLGTHITEVDKGVYYCPFGTTLELTPDIHVLFAGGAESADKQYRLRKMQEEGFPKIWWEQEGISEADMARLNEVSRAEWVVSHAAPRGFSISGYLDGGLRHRMKRDEPSRNLLEQILIKYQPLNWFFGHYHRYMAGKKGECIWEGLAELGSLDRWWSSALLWYDEDAHD